jgi:hypothetical protein
LEFRLPNGKRLHIFEPRRVPEVAEEPFKARRHEAGQHAGRVVGRVPEGVDGPPRHVQELLWSQRAPGILEENLDAALQDEEGFVRVSVRMGSGPGGPAGMNTWKRE